jgi:competence protein ComEC
LVSLVFPPGVETVFRGAAFLGDLLVGTARWGASWPGARISFAVLPPLWTGVYYLILFRAFSFMVPSPIPAAARHRRKRGLIWGGVLTVFCLLWGVWGFWPNRLEVTFLSVGLGSAVHLKIPGGHHVLVDAGPIRGRYEAGAKVVVPYLEKRGVNRLDLLVLTHPHRDHAGGTGAVLERFPGALRVEQAFPGDAWEWGRVRLEVLAGGEESGTGGNAGSLALRLSWGNFSCLFLGDLDQKGQRNLVALGKTSPVTVLQVAHHGSRYSFLPVLAAAVRPALAVISVGPNSYGHPHPEVREWFQTQKTPLIRTDQRGAVIISTDGRSTVYTAVRPGG